MQTVTAVLTIYKRVDNLEKQIKSLLAQTYKIDKFIINVNLTERRREYTYIINKLIPGALIIEHSFNLGVWSRFFISFNANTDFIFILDDDIIPGTGYIQNCIDCYNQKPGIYGSWGSNFKNLKIRKDRDILSESNNIPSKITQVDMSGHSWFFGRSNLSSMFDKLPNDLEKFKVCGEELWVSYRALANGINTYVPPMNNQELTGNLEPTLGHDQNAGFNQFGNNLYQEFYDYCILDGFLPLNFK